jgi:RecA-family ATPase
MSAMNDPWTNDAYPEPRVLNLADYRATRFTGPPPPIKWLVQHSIPLGVPVLFAAMGGVGKSFLTLQLCHLVATPPLENPGAPDGQIHNLNTYTRPLLGGTVVEHGKAVLITAEDSDDVIHRRLAVVDPYERRTDDLIIIALPSAGGPMPFFVQDRDGVRATNEWLMLREQLLNTTSLKLIAVDPLAAFAQVPLDADSAAASFVVSAFGQLAAATGATVLLSHHMRKPPSGKTPQTPAEARDAIRGSTAIVDGVRLAYALWQVEEAEGKKVCNDLEILPFDPSVSSQGRHRQDQ